MSEAVIVAIVSVGVMAFVACAGAIWRLAAANAEKASQIADLRRGLDELKADVASRLAEARKSAEDRFEGVSTRIGKVEEAADHQRREDEKQWRSWTGILSELMGEIRGREKAQAASPYRVSPRRSRPDEER